MLKAHNPGVLAFALYLVRVTTHPVLLAFAILAPFASSLPRHPLAGLTMILGYAVLIEDCGRSGFARRADRPLRAPS